MFTREHELDDLKKLSDNYSIKHLLPILEPFSNSGPEGRPLVRALQKIPMGLFGSLGHFLENGHLLAPKMTSISNWRRKVPTWKRFCCSYKLSLSIDSPSSIGSMS